MTSKELRKLADKAINHAAPTSPDDVRKLRNAYGALGFAMEEHLDFCESKPKRKVKKKRERHYDPPENG